MESGNSHVYCGEDDLGIGLRFQVEIVFRLLYTVQTGSGYTQPTVKWVAEVLFSPDVKLTPQSSAQVTVSSFVGALKKHTDKFGFLRFSNGRNFHVVYCRDLVASFIKFRY